MPKNIRQQITLSATTKDLYARWMDARKHAAFTGARAAISRKVGGKFSCHGGYITGFNLYLKPGQRIVQAWRGSDWSEGYYSVIDLHIHPAGRRKSLLTFEQSGVPDDHVDSIRQGWIDYYWTPLEAFLREAEAQRVIGLRLARRRSRSSGR